MQQSLNSSNPLGRGVLAALLSVLPLFAQQGEDQPEPPEFSENITVAAQRDEVLVKDIAGTGDDLSYLVNLAHDMEAGGGRN